MAILNVNSTRMELNKLKNRLKTTRRGYNLLKNKADGLLQEFLNISKKTISFKKEIREKIIKSTENLKLAEIETKKEAIDCAFIFSKQKIKIKPTNSNILGVSTISFSVEEKLDLKNSLSYSFFSTSQYLDKAVKINTEILLDLIELSEKEKTLFILSSEIQKTKRKVNAIENILIPNLEETIRYISLKLEETQRNTIAALSRIKSKS